MDIGMIGEEGNGYKRVNAGTKKRKKKHQGKEIRNSGDSGNEQEVRNENLDELKVILTFKEDGGIQKVSPIELTKELRKVAGEMKLAENL